MTAAAIINTVVQSKQLCQELQAARLANPKRFGAHAQHLCSECPSMCPLCSKFVTWAGHGKSKDSKVKESTAVKLSKRGALEFPDEMQLDVPGEQRKDPQAAGQYKESGIASVCACVVCGQGCCDA